jgi:hypothetical protein
MPASVALAARIAFFATDASVSSAFDQRGSSSPSYTQCRRRGGSGICRLIRHASGDFQRAASGLTAVAVTRLWASTDCTQEVLTDDIWPSYISDQFARRANYFIDPRRRAANCIPAAAEAKSCRVAPSSSSFQYDRCDVQQMHHTSDVSIIANRPSNETHRKRRVSGESIINRRLFRCDGLASYSTCLTIDMDLSINTRSCTMRIVENNILQPQQNTTVTRPSS